MHLIDLMWGVLAVAFAAVPAYRLFDNRHRPGALYLLGLVLVCAIYPWAYIIYPYTFFDQGLVFLFTTWIGPLYLLAISTYLTVHPAGWVWMRNGLLITAACLSLLAVTNPLHGQFATFADVAPTVPLTTTGQIAHGPAMRTMGGLSIACIVVTVVLIGFQYSRSHFRFSQLITMTLFPVLAGFAYLLPNNALSFLPESVNPVILSTTVGLGVLAYTLQRTQFLEIRPIAREAVLNLLPDAMAVVDNQGNIVDGNAHLASLLGMETRAAIGSSLVGRLADSIWDLGADSEATRSCSLEVDGSLRFYQVHLARLDQKSRSGEVLLLLRDTTEQTLAHKRLEASQVELRALNNELARLSNTDALTGLRNRRYFLDQLSQEYERASRLKQPFALLSIDLDDFKAINDNYGHNTGDQALISAARAMESACRAVDTLARVGGEEFMVMLLDLDDTQLEQVAERFRRAISETLIEPNGGKTFGLTASIGAASINPDTDVQTALRQIDEALYEAKRAGRNRVVVREVLLTNTV
jgi:diguanylate cyclase (GGDEF)-like protein